MEGFLGPAQGPSVRSLLWGPCEVTAWALWAVAAETTVLSGRGLSGPPEDRWATRDSCGTQAEPGPRLLGTSRWTEKSVQPLRESPKCAGSRGWGPPWAGGRGGASAQGPGVLCWSQQPPQSGLSRLASAGRPCVQVCASPSSLCTGPQASPGLDPGDFRAGDRERQRGGGCRPRSSRPGQPSRKGWPEPGQKADVQLAMCALSGPAPVAPQPARKCSSSLPSCQLPTPTVSG